MKIRGINQQKHISAPVREDPLRRMKPQAGECGPNESQIPRIEVTKEKS